MWIVNYFNARKHTIAAATVITKVTLNYCIVVHVEVKTLIIFFAQIGNKEFVVIAADSGIDQEEESLDTISIGSFDNEEIPLDFDIDLRPKSVKLGFNYVDFQRFTKVE